MTLFGKEQSLLRTAVQGARALVGKPEVPTRAAVGRVAVLGHRGAPRQVAENTVLGCRRAIEQGADGVEVDLCVTRDGKVVLWHDRDPDPGTMLVRQAAEGSEFAPRVPADLCRPVTELDWSQLAAQFGQKRRTDDTFIGIDTLDQFIAWAAGEPRAGWLMLDVKLAASEVGFVPELLARLSELIPTHPGVRSRNLRLLTPVREIYEAIERGLSGQPALKSCETTADFELGGVVEVAHEIGARHIGIGVTPVRPWSLVRQDLAAAIDARNAGDLESVMLWTLNEEDVLREACAWGVDAVLTDDVPGARRVVGAS